MVAVNFPEFAINHVEVLVREEFGESIDVVRVNVQFVQLLHSSYTSKLTRT